MTKREEVIEWLKGLIDPDWPDRDTVAAQSALALIADLTAENKEWREAWDRKDINRRWCGLTELDDSIGDRLRPLRAARARVDGWDKEADRDPTTNIIGTCPKCGLPIAREYPTHYCGEGGGNG